MHIVGYNWDSLNRHGVTAEMIDEVQLGGMVSYFALDEGDDTCEILVGYTLTERLLEIGIRFVDAESMYIFHAQNVSPAYRQLFEEEWGNG
jgi:hypothetical protein